LPSSYIKVTEELINRIKHIAEIEKVQLKPLILQLADHLAEGIKVNRPDVIAKLKTILAQDTEKPRGQDEINIKLVSQLIKKIKSQNFPSVSDNWIMKVLPAKYKEEARNIVVEQMIHSENITDENLYRIKDDIKNRIRSMETIGPSKDIKVKETVPSIERYTWNCHVAQELARLAIKMEKEHETHDDSYCKDSAKAIKMARDLRFATTYSRYQALVIASEHTRSLANVSEGEWNVLTRWEVEQNEKNCTECLSRDQCASTQCNHVCHQVVKELTTKGVKWAIRTNDKLKDLQKGMRRLATDSDDLCEMMKAVFKNPHTTSKLNEGDKKNLMAKHLDIDVCDQCLLFTSDHPDFFREHLGV